MNVKFLKSQVKDLRTIMVIDLRRLTTRTRILTDCPDCKDLADIKSYLSTASLDTVIHEIGLVNYSAVETPQGIIVGSTDSGVIFYKNGETRIEPLNTNKLGTDQLMTLVELFSEAKVIENVVLNASLS